MKHKKQKKARFLIYVTPQLKASIARLAIADDTTPSRYAFLVLKNHLESTKDAK